MPNIKAKNYYGEHVRRENVNKVLYESADEEGIKIPFTFGEAVSKEVEPDFSSGNNMEVPIAEGELVTKLSIIKPTDLVPEKIAEGEYIAGVGPGTHVGSKVDFDFSDPLLQFFTYQLDTENKTIVLWRLFYDVLYTATGSYNVTIPDKIGGYDVVVSCL